MLNCSEVGRAAAEVVNEAGGANAGPRHSMHAATRGCYMRA